MSLTAQSVGSPESSLVGYLSRKALPIKRNDAEPLTREDVQYDLLHQIFSDTKAVFTSQAPGCSNTSKIRFCDLYVNALYHSSKCSKVLKDKMNETPPFAIELAKISLLTNVGRINTTMAFFPEMKTALRTYHPVPSLQKTDGNAQDAPRIKNCLKAALLPYEIKSMPPSTPEEILDRSRAGRVPPTSVVNLIFVLANHAAPLANVHFDPPLNFLDLFLPINVSSTSRARAFLWLIYHYLEGPELPNPYDDDYSRQNDGKVPWLHRLSETEFAKENVDTPDEIAWGKRMSSERNTFLQKLVNNTHTEKKERYPPTPAAPVLQKVFEPTNSYRTHSSRQQIPEVQREKPFLHYMPPQRDSIQPAHLPRGNIQPRSDFRGGPERSMLQQAWHVIMNTDPLVDSDEELPDQHVRHDYSRRVDVIARLRGRPPSPLPDAMVVDRSISGRNGSGSARHG
ncbi:hypothetical protein SERLA73DRAFT_179227 [Serpula lacrymans var. lacrymans S7.3]|uniref:Ino eighty subunit 1 n=2 Tax=Serpula lacrymans var. lacrymans TaxID=341189 RepID=F8PRK6_SERL3|nr:uncharacterized protein SERLADRAFT_464246 [Serpula lacrymans var. lacrymans S7.9]EGO01145.1 hypothetical protein SERLA73DRAFT_179227 [Serpula lacrymans var. lacrymans S7.3]EGO26795.1 hypothetical protein SERLADRAFT_464246 [Serpula lacrymans var. lacrymans S7.9]